MAGEEEQEEQEEEEDDDEELDTKPVFLFVFLDGKLWATLKTSMHGSPLALRNGIIQLFHTRLTKKNAVVYRQAKGTIHVFTEESWENFTTDFPDDDAEEKMKSMKRGVYMGCSEEMACATYTEMKNTTWSD